MPTKPKRYRPVKQQTENLPPPLWDGKQERLRGRKGVERRRRILRRDQYVCQMCREGFHEKDLEVDHIVPLELGGPDKDDNLQVLCIDCHRTKTYAEQGYEPDDSPF